jgi:transcriptional regulator with XRE-family HTH domain
MEGRNRFGVKVKKLRREKGLSIRELAEQVGMDFTRLGKIEQGLRPPPEPELIARLAKVLDVDVFELIEAADFSEEFWKSIAESPKARAYFTRVQSSMGRGHAR